MESIEINGMEIYARHGVLPQENAVGNTFKVDLRIDLDLSRAMDSDNVVDTVNYARVIEIVKHEMDISSSLLERVASRIKNAILAEFPQVTGGMVRIAKLTPPIACQVSSVAIVTRW